MDDSEDDPSLTRQRQLKQQKKTEMVAESSDTATIKKLHVSSANLQRVRAQPLLLQGWRPLNDLLGLRMAVWLWVKVRELRPRLYSSSACVA